MTGQISPAPRVSVAIAAYNHAPFVRECIESVQAQTFTDWEIVVTDDGSSDGTAEILRELAATDPRVRVQSFAANQGACVAINDAITRARGEFIAILNSDDRFLPDKLAQQVDFLDRNPEQAAVFTRPRLIDERGRPFADTEHKDYRIFEVANRSRRAWLDHFFHAGNCLCHPSVLIRRACYGELGAYDPRLAQLPDLDMWVRVCSRHEIHILDERLVDFRIRDGERNASAARPEVLAREPWERLQILRHYLTPDLAAMVTPRMHADQPATERPPLVRLAWTALAIGTPAHRALALEILHQALDPNAPAADGLPSVPEYLRLTGQADVFWQSSLALCHRLQTEFERLRQEAAEQAGELAGARTEAQALQTEIEALRQRLETHRTALASTEARLQTLQSSRSWRLTAPLRQLTARWGAFRDSVQRSTKPR
jgi:hypothetical protein